MLKSLDGEPPSLMDNFSGCSFAPRCPEPSENCSSGNAEMGLIKVGEDTLLINVVWSVVK